LHKLVGKIAYNRSKLSPTLALPSSIYIECESLRFIIHKVSIEFIPWKEATFWVLHNPPTCDSKFKCVFWTQVLMSNSIILGSCQISTSISRHPQNTSWI
jgi:hypothetical protein